MDIFSQKKVLIRLVVILAILNVMSVGIMLWNGIVINNSRNIPPRVEKRDLSTILKNELNLTDQQAEQIKEIRDDFFKEERKLSSVIKMERDSMNTLMFNKNTDEQLVKSIARRVAENDYQMEMLRFEQAKQMKSICSKEQLEKFGSLVREIRDYFKPDNKHENRPAD
jgi:Spy/CpxP family protein refolding chaperone